MTTTSNTVTFTVTSSSIPAYFSGATEKTWIELTTSIEDVDPCPGNACAYSQTEGQDAVCDDWCGAVASPDSLIIAAQGGHSGYAGNEVYECDFTQASPAWARRVNPSTSVQQNVSYYSDGKPSSRHGENMDCFIPSGITNGNRWFSPLGYSVYGNGGTGTIKAASWPRGTSAYDAQSTFPDFPGTSQNANEATVAWDSADELVWVKEANDSVSGGLFSFNPATNTWSSRYGSWVLGTGHNTACIDPVRRIFLNYDGSTLYGLDLDSPSTSPVTITTSGTAPGGNAPGLIFDPVSNCFIGWNGGATLRKLTPGANWKTDSWTWSAITNHASNSVTPTSANANGTYGRFNYISSLRALCVVNRTTESTYLYKLPAGSV